MLDSEIATEFEYDLLKDSAEWKLNDQVKIPHVTKYYDDMDVILGFDNIVFVFYFTKAHNFEIWCHHLLDNKLYKSKYKVPEIKTEIWQFTFVIKDGNNDTHILNFGSGKHLKVDLLKLVPNELLKSHQKYYQPLIMGYLREEENENDIPCIPVALKTLILKFFPL